MDTQQEDTRSIKIKRLKSNQRHRSSTSKLKTTQHT